MKYKINLNDDDTNTTVCEVITLFLDNDKIKEFVFSNLVNDIDMKNSESKSESTFNCLFRIVNEKCN